MTKLTLCLIFILLAAGMGVAKKKPSSEESRAQYLRRLGAENTPAPAARLPLLYLTSDVVARVPGDLLRIRIVEQTTAQSTGAVKAARTTDFAAGISGIGGGVGTTNLNPLLSMQSKRSLDGQGQADSSSQLRTDLMARVVAQLSSGTLVIEASRDVLVNQERRRIIVRGLVRPVDIGPENIVLSTQLSDLEIEMEGKGVVSDATKGPNRVVRLLHALLGF